MLDLARRQASVGGVDIGLSPAEFATVHLLFARSGMPLSKELISAALPIPCGSADCRMVDVYVGRARAKFAAAGLPRVIATVWGRGYMAGNCDEDDPAEPPTTRGLGAALVAV